MASSVSNEEVNDIGWQWIESSSEENVEKRKGKQSIKDGA